VGFARKLVTTSLVVGGAVGVLALFNKFTESQVNEPGTVLKGEERRYPWKYGDIFYQVKGSRDAKPLLLIHGFGPGASSFEWRKNVDVLAERFRVYTLDLLGFGLSDRAGIDYTAETFADLISDFVKEAIGKPTVVVAHGLTCADVPGPFNNALKFVLRTPILGQFVYNMLTSRRAIRAYYDSQGYHNPGLITDELVEYAYSSAHQPNSRYPAASFISNNLTMDAHEPLARLQMPIVAIWGREEVFTPTETSDAFKSVNASIDVRILEKARQQLQDEQAAKFNALVYEFAGATVAQ
jgi:pimeloyl-ACP methyl ester carboxylesterase